MKPGDERINGDHQVRVLQFVKKLNIATASQLAYHLLQILPTLMVAIDSDAAESIQLLLNYNFQADTDKNGDNILCRAIRKGKKYECTAFVGDMMYYIYTVLVDVLQYIAILTG